MMAGAVLVEQALHLEHERFGLLYPILFNYWHGLEVAIKWTLDRYGRYSAIETYDKNHNLDTRKGCRWRTSGGKYVAE